MSLIAEWRALAHTSTIFLVEDSCLFFVYSGMNPLSPFLKLRRVCCISLLIAGAGSGVLGADSSANTNFRAGIAVEIVTPEPLLPVSGGLGPSVPVNRKLGELTVRALYLANDETELVIVSADFLGFPGALARKVHALVPDIPSDHILIGATHTHSAPDCYGFPDGRGGIAADLDYVDTVCQKMAKAIRDAKSAAQPAAIKCASGKLAERIAYNYYAPELYDRRGSALQVLSTGQDPQPIATLINYAIHPEVLGPKQGVVSPDLIGPLYDRLAAKGAGVGIFMNGAQGGMVTADCRGPDGKDIQTWEECQRIGNLLADETLRILDDAPIIQSPTLKVTSKTIRLPVESSDLLAVLSFSPWEYDLNSDDEIATRINYIQLANARMITIPGEALPNIGFYLKRQMNGDHPFLFGLTNDAFGYILTPVDWNSFERYNYVSRVCLGERTGEIYLREAMSLMSDSKN